MITTKTNSTTKNNNIKLLITNSILMTTFIAFIDEGNYNFQWIFDLGSWVAFFIYSILFFAILFLVFQVLLKKHPQFGKLILSVLIVAITSSIILLGISHN